MRISSSGKSPMCADVLRLHHHILTTRTEGPGLRAGIWVQGCPNHCDGCMAQDTWSFSDGYEMTVGALANEILAVPCLEGATFAGGEPFCQAGTLAHLARLLRRAGLSIIVTGYTLAQLREMSAPSVTALLDRTDVLIDGPYIKERACQNIPLVGSSNQRYHFLTDRYTSLTDMWTDGKNKIEIRILPDGSISANGMLPETLLGSLPRSATEGKAATKGAKDCETLFPL